MPSIQEFLGQINAQRGLSKPNWFCMQITKESGGIERTVSMFCQATELPSYNLLTAPLQTYGPPQQLVYGRAFQEIQMTFLLDSHMRVKKFFEDWIGLAAGDGVTGSFDVNYYDNYTKQINIVKLTNDRIEVDEEKNCVHQAILYNAYPVNTSTVNLSQEAQNGFNTMGVTFTFEKIKHVYAETTHEFDPHNLTKLRTNAFRENLVQLTGSENRPFGGESR